MTDVQALDASQKKAPLLSLVTPAFNEAENLSVLNERLCRALQNTDIEWEWIVVDDHSKDGTFEKAVELQKTNPRIQAIRLSRNFGSHAAITCGLAQTRGKCAIVMAADLQDPPEEIERMIEEWKSGSKIVWAVRASRLGEKASNMFFSRLYYRLMRKTSALSDMPGMGADFFLLDRLVINAFIRFSEQHTSILALLTWMGFPQSFISYQKQERLHGKSGWTFSKKIKLVIDSITSFTSFPIRAMTYLGSVTACVGFLYALFLVFNAIFGEPLAGWSSIMVAVMILGGVQMLMLGMLGQYLWRALEESRRRPRYLIEDQASSEQG